MNAFIYRKYGPPDVLRMEAVPLPVPSATEIRVKVFAAPVNRTDCANLTAQPAIMRLTMGMFKPKKQIPGTGFSGKVEAIGKDVTLFREGDQVFGFDDSGTASFAEYLVIDQHKGVAVFPPSLTFQQAAASIEGMHYAYNFINKVELKPGDHVLVNGASGAIGSAMVQLLKYFNTHCTAVCSTTSIPIIKSLGADNIINYQERDFTTDTASYDFIFDAVGKSSYGRCRHLLKPGGVYISSELGWMIQNVFYSLISALFGSLPLQSGKKVRFPYPPDIPRSIKLLTEIINANAFQPVIDRSYPFEKLPDAFRYVLTGNKIGNVVIDFNIPS